MVSCCLSQASTFPTRPPSAWEVSLKLSAEHVAILQGFPAGFGVGLSLQCDSGEHVTPDPRLPLCRSVVLNALHELGRLPEVSLQGENWLHAVTQSSLILCDPRDHSTLGLPVHHQLPEFTQTHVH